MSETGHPADAASNKRRVEYLVSFWSFRMPSVFERWSPDIADAFADGNWIANRYLYIAAYAPIAAVIFGFLAPFLWPGMQTVYSESLTFVATVVVGGILSGSVGVMLLIGYVIGDLLSGAREMSLGGLGGQIISYMLLSLPAVKIPALIRRFAENDKLPKVPFLRNLLIVVVYGFTSGTFTFLWCQAMIVLIRPVYTWRGRSPDVSAIEPIQTSWEWIVMLALAATAIRFFLQRPIDNPMTSETSQTPSVWRTIVWAISITMILAGTYESWIDALIVGLVAGFLGLLRTRPKFNLLDKWSVLVNNVPAPLRLAAASSIGFLICLALLQAFWNRGSLRPIAFGALITMSLFMLLFPPQPPIPTSKGAP